MGVLQQFGVWFGAAEHGIAWVSDSRRRSSKRVDGGVVVDRGNRSRQRVLRLLRHPEALPDGNAGERLWIVADLVAAWGSGLVQRHIGS